MAKITEPDEIYERYSNLLLKKEFVTPYLAREWLSLPKQWNRRLDLDTVAIYARLMSSGEWVLTETPIRFGEFGQVQNGQHRIHACVQSNTGFWCYIGRLPIVSETETATIGPSIMSTLCTSESFDWDEARYKAIEDTVRKELGKVYGR